MPVEPQPSRSVAFWLLPAASFAEAFAEIIGALAREFDAPAFAPHVTLYAGRQTADDNPVAVAAQVVAAASRIELTAAATATADKLFKTLFVEFAPDARVERLGQTLRQGFKQPGDYVLQPHLSLLYKLLPETTRHALTKRFDFRGQRIAFDAIAVVHPGAGTDTWEAIERWEIEARFPLT